MNFCQEETNKSGKEYRKPLNKLPKDEQNYLLELNYSFTNKEFSINKMEEIFDWIDRAHNRVEDAFESCITQNLRDMFNEEASK